MAHGLRIVKTTDSLTIESPKHSNSPWLTRVRAFPYSGGRAIDAHGAQVAFDIPASLAKALFVFDHRDADETFSIFTISDTRSYCDTGLSQKLLGKFKTAHLHQLRR